MTTPEQRLDEPAPATLFSAADSEELWRRWDDIQLRFIEDPRAQVDEADRLVGDVLDQVRAYFDRQRRELREGWEQGEEVTTEQLRQVLQRYRSFLEQTLHRPAP